MLDEAAAGLRGRSISDRLAPSGNLKLFSTSADASGIFRLFSMD
jgi:hypothetical protein